MWTTGNSNVDIGFLVQCRFWPEIQKKLKIDLVDTGDSQHPVHFLRKPSTQVLLNRMGLQHFDQNEKSDDFYAL